MTGPGSGSSNGGTTGPGRSHLLSGTPGTGPGIADPKTALAVYTAPIDGFNLRTILRDGEPWFVAGDVCKALGLANPHSSTALLDEDERGLHSVDTPGGRQLLGIVSESGLYSLILRSRRPEARAFKRWITGEVLPAIRRTGGYQAAPALPATYADALRELAATVEQSTALAQQLAITGPKAQAWEQLASADGDYSVADAAKILSRDPDIKVGSGRLFSILRDLGWIYRQGVDQRWRVYQTAVETGRLSELPASHYHPKTGELVLDPPQVRVTVKGIEYLRRQLTT
jgi:anti-repressor protein